MTLLEDIIAYLVGVGLVAGDGIDAFRDFIPDDPDNIVCLYEYPGEPIGPYSDTAHRSIQVIVRNKNASEAQKHANALCGAFRPLSESLRIDFTTTRWGQVYVRQTPFKIKQDERNRTQYGFNLGITTIIE
jgi:hypothetical protein